MKERSDIAGKHIRVDIEEAPEGGYTIYYQGRIWGWRKTKEQANEFATEIFCNPPKIYIDWQNGMIVRRKVE